MCVEDGDQGSDVCYFLNEEAAMIRVKETKIASMATVIGSK